MIQRIQKNLTAGGTVDVEELDDLWIPRMFDTKPTAKVWKRTGTNPDSYNGDTFYSDNDETLRPLTADDANAYWDLKYPGFTRTGNPTPLSNCEDFAKGGSNVNYRDGASYDLDQLAERNRLKDLLDAGRHVLQLGAVKLTAHFLIADHQGGNVTITQKDGDSAIYHKVMSSADAVTYTWSKSSKVMELHRA